MNLDRLLGSLAESRPVFHSEADFQHALAWEMHEHHRDWRIRPEWPAPACDACVDIWSACGGREVAVELKYKTAGTLIEHEGERFYLRGHGAQNENRYLFLEDVERLERLTAQRPQAIGYAIFLTNDRGYWNTSRAETPEDAAFRLDAGRIMTGTLAWPPGATKRPALADPIVIRGSYSARWSDYSFFPGTDDRFRYLLLEVRPPGS